MDMYGLTYSLLSPTRVIAQEGMDGNMKVGVRKCKSMVCFSQKMNFMDKVVQSQFHLVH